MAAMSVIGIDLGNESCYVAVAKAGGIETIANDYSLRATPLCVAFSGKNRILGVAAKNQQVTNIKNTVYGLKRLLGRKYRDPHVQRELTMLPFNVIEVANGNIGIKVNYLNEEHIFSPEQCLAMLLTKLKDVSVAALQTPINDCVISVPSYFTNNERKALLDSASIAGLNVLRLFNETTATALSYGIYKQDLPAAEEKPRNVIFVDCGHSSLQVSAVAFNKGKLRMIATTADPNLGGRDFDHMLADHFCREFQSKYKIEAKTNARAYLRLLAEVEKLKKQMSANSTSLPLNIECFMDDKDVHADMKRADMENLCESLFQRVEQTLQDCLEQSELSLEDIHSVEIVGGSTRIPAIKQRIERVFNKVPSTTLNQDESVSRGCALQCAMLSPAVRVRDFSVTDVQSYPISVSWEASAEGDAGGNVEIFPVKQAVPFSRLLTFYRHEPFAVKASYSGNVPYPDKNIGTWIINDVRPNAEGKAQKVKVKLRLNIHGIMSVSSASMYEAKNTSEDDKEDQQQMNEADQKMETQQNNDEAAAPNEQTGDKAATPPEDGDKEKKKKNVVKSVELPIKSLTYGFSQVELNQYTEQEFKMIAADRQEKERADTRNALEEYVYELRDKLSADGDLHKFVSENDRSKLVQQLDEMENWLYEEGEDCVRQIYQDKLSELKSKGEPIENRRVEYELRPILFNDFGKSLQLCLKAIDQIRNNDPKYAHLTQDDLIKLEDAYTNSYKWLEETRSKKINLELPPSITVAQIKQEKNAFEGIVNPILNKQPPKTKTPPKDEKENKNAEPTQQPEKQENAEPERQTNEQQQSQENMEWS